MAVERLLTKAFDAEEKKRRQLKRIWRPNRMPDFFALFVYLEEIPHKSWKKSARSKWGLKIKIPQDFG